MMCVNAIARVEARGQFFGVTSLLPPAAENIPGFQRSKSGCSACSGCTTRTFIWWPVFPALFLSCCRNIPIAEHRVLKSPTAYQ